MASHILFWTSLALLAYTFLGYQLLIRLLARFHRPSAPDIPSPPQRAMVLIVAHNEEARIRARLKA